VGALGLVDGALRAGRTLETAITGCLLQAAFAERAVLGVETGQLGRTLAHLAGVGQALGRPLADVAVGAAAAEEALAGGSVGHAVGSVRSHLAVRTSRAFNIIAGQSHADGSRHALLVLVTFNFSAGQWHADGSGLRVLAALELPALLTPVLASEFRCHVGAFVGDLLLTDVVSGADLVARCNQEELSVYITFIQVDSPRSVIMQRKRMTSPRIL